MPDPAPHHSPLFDPVALLGERFRAAIAAAFPAAVPPEGAGAIDPLITATRDPKLGDFQSNAAMGLAKRLGMKPRDIAAAIVAKVDLSGVGEPLTPEAVAGPGFINIRLSGPALTRLLVGMDTPKLGIEPASPPRTMVVDLFGVNLAKQMHVGHIRSPIIGDTIARSLERVGHRVVRQNHAGDWGLPIAMVTARLMEQASAGKIDLGRITLDDLDRAYKSTERESDADEAGLCAVKKYGLGPKALAELEDQVLGAREVEQRARRTLVALQAHEPATFAVWQRIHDVTMATCLAACRRLHVNCTAEHEAGESSYAGELAGIVEDLTQRGIAEESEGAIVVRVDTPPWNIAEPCIIRKRDGGFLYATTDLAAIRRRVQKIGAERVIYAVDARQSLHFRQVFAAASRAGYSRLPDGREAALEHAAFGAILGEDGRPFKSRSGDNVKLADLLDELVTRAARIVAEKNPDLPETERAPIAEAVGIAAIKYGDLSTDRAKDYVFSFDRMLAFEGNTGPYLLYALVRVRSIFRKAEERGVPVSRAASAPLSPTEPAEKALALALLRYPAAVRGVGDAMEPHRLCQYLYELAGAFSGFFDACPVLQAPDEATRDSRLRLCALTGRVLADGLGVLGIPTLERM